MTNNTVEQMRGQTACDLLDDADVLHEFDDSVTLRVDRELWLQYLRGE